MSDSEYAVEMSHVTVAYRSYQERPTSLKESIINAVRHGKFKYYSTFNALTDISLQVKRGNILGVIGSNGAGKSTLLNVLAGVLPPSEGHAIVRGNMDSLRALGAGFDSELNAIENIYLYGSLHGKSKTEIKQSIPKILEFAELADFATTPIKYYSSGMHARLGFAAAIDTNPEVLLVDEVLAVGDERFQEKCHKVFESYLTKGRTIVIVSHNMNVLLRICSEIAVLSKGRLVYIGNPKDAIEMYRNKSYETALGS
ncbi:MAG: ABC transporter ATP-binding protein [Bdellovibrionales bacterium]|nr:ABC transporter ATP-binding protein [Bdellovibrionales bacterium]